MFARLGKLGKFQDFEYRAQKPGKALYLFTYLTESPGTRKVFRGKKSPPLTVPKIFYSINVFPQPGIVPTKIVKNSKSDELQYFLKIPGRTSGGGALVGTKMLTEKILNLWTPT